MAPFQFPDPNVATTVVNSETGETWVYVDGVWEVKIEDDDGVVIGDDIDFTHINNQLEQLTAAVTSLQTSIIEMNSRVSTLEGDTVLIIE
tara:strand:+ start:1638 stop:1907 length:270 start_codon:yes stop_codon:yes gene_type:complete